MMKLSKLLSSVEVIKFEGNGEAEVRGIAYDSRKVKPKDLFVAIKGFKTDGHLYILEAIAKGAIAVVVENWQKEPLDNSQILVPNSRKALAFLSRTFFDHPSSKLKLIGVTGTNGKTSTTYLIQSILSEAGKRTGLVGTVEYKIGEKILAVGRTTPESYKLQRLFSEMLKEGVEFAVLEASSHAIHQHRLDGLNFDVLVFTNLSPEHLDYHKNLPEYFKVKSELFRENLGQATQIINIDDPYGKKLLEISNKRTYLYGLGDSADIKASEVKLTEWGSNFKVLTSTKALDLCTKLKGLFNVYNSLAAISVGMVLGLPAKAIKSGIERIINIPGRFESIDLGQDFTVIVDYAHTPDSLQKVLTTAKKMTKGRLITVFGCGGERDRIKRPLMGKTSGHLSDFTILTSDNPRGEDSETIIGQIEKGIKKAPSAKYGKIENRKEAIFKAISLAQKGDLVLIAGKGHEAYQIFKDKVLSFDDRKVVREALQNIGYG